MTMYKALIPVLVSLFFFHPSYAQNDFCHITNTSFKDGEKLVFKAYYNMSRIWIHAGNAVFNVASEQLDNKKVFHITGTGKTQKSYEWFYKVNDKYESFIDEKTLLPYRFIRNVNEGGFRIYNNITFNQAIGQAISTKAVYTVPKLQSGG
jgi:hypothetical protein